MRKTFTLFTLLFALSLLPTAAVAQRIAAYFVTTPNEVLPTLSTNRRKDMVDFARSGKFNYVENELGGESRLTHLTENSIAIELSSASTLQMQLLQTTDSATLIAIVHTLCAPACTSTLALYDINWHPQPIASYMELPTVAQFVTDTVAANRVDVMLSSYQVSADTLTITPQLEAYLPVEMYEEVAPHLQSLTYLWTGDRFESIAQ